MDIDLEDLFDAAGASPSLMERVDQAWNQAWNQAGGGQPRFVRSYVRATQAVVVAVFEGLGRTIGAPHPLVALASDDVLVSVPLRQRPHRELLAFEPAEESRSDTVEPSERGRDREQGLDLDDIVARVVAVPLYGGAERPGRAVARASVVLYGSMAGVAIGRISVLGGVDEVATPAPLIRASVAHGASRFLVQIAEATASSPGVSISKIRRVLMPDNEETLAHWLGASRPTVRAWELGDSLAEHDRGRRVRAVVRIAELLDEHLDPDQVARYVHSTTIEAIGDATIAAALGSSSTTEIEDIADGLADALVW